MGLSRSIQRGVWIFFAAACVLARSDRIRETITDGTTAKGAAYKRLISSLVSTGEITKSEKRWAQSVEYIKFDIDQSFGPDEVVSAHFQIRRLLLTPYHLRMGYQPFTEYQCYTPSNMRVNGFQPSFTTQAEYDAHWIQRFLWDSRYDPQRARGKTLWEIKPVLGMGIQASQGEGELPVTMDVLENQSAKDELPQWEKTHRVVKNIRYTVDPDRVVVPDVSNQLRDQIQDHFEARLVVEYDSQESAWIPVVKLVRAKGAKGGPEDTVLFGGMVSVRYIRTDFNDQYGQSLLDNRNDQSWWQWGWRYDEGHKFIVDQTDDGQDNPTEVIFGDAQKRLFTAHHELSTSLPGEMQTQQILPSYGDSKYKLVVRITPMRGNSKWTYGGLWADRVYQGELEFPLERWNLQELKRYIVNGTVPDHAMP